MKQIYIEEQAKGQVNQNFKGGNSEVHQTIIRVQPNSDFLNIFQIRNKGKGPPGRTRSPGVGECLFPEHPPDGKAGSGDDFFTPYKVQNSVRGKKQTSYPINTEYQNINTYKILQTLNFTIMKKQILFLSFFVLAILAGNNANAQYVNYLTAANAAAVGCTPAAVLNCNSASDALHPLPGVTYTYGVTVNPAISGTGTVHWFVTDQVNLITSATLGTPVLQTTRDAGTNGTYVLASGPTLLAGSAAYNDPANAIPQISISWKYFDGVANKVLLVAYVTDNNGCTNNIDVYQIQPAFGFTLAIAGMLDNGTIPALPADAKECVSPVESAVYTPGAPGTIAVDYGENWVFFSVNAANFVGSWMPDFSTVGYTGTAANVLETEYQWAYPADAISGTATGWHAESVPVMAAGGANAAVGVAGECIVVRARINHGVTDQLASPTGSVLTLGVDGTMYDPTGAGSYTNILLKDKDNNPSGLATDPCVQNITDKADFTLTPRPALTSNTQPANATKDPFLQKN